MDKKWSILIISTLAFTVNFAVWTIFGIIGIKIQQELSLSELEFSLLLSLPILTGSISRVPLGILTDIFGGRILFIAQMSLVSVSLLLLVFASQYWHFIVASSLLGISGGSFAIGIAYIAKYFSQKSHGTAMGIFGVGNIGAALTNLIAPIIIISYGWRLVPLTYSISMLLTIVIFFYVTKDSKISSARIGIKPYPQFNKIEVKRQLLPLGDRKVWLFGFYYFFTFGGFVGLAAWLPQYYMNVFELDLKTASFITIAFTLPSGLVRAFGGWWSDRIDHNRLNLIVFSASSICLWTLVHISGLSLTAFTSVIFTLGFLQGIGKASLFTSLAAIYPANMGAAGGCVGMIGGLGGFVLPIIFSFAKDLTGTVESCFSVLLAVSTAGLILMVLSSRVSPSSFNNSKLRTMDLTD